MPRCITDFDIGNEIGKGGFGRVFEVREKSTHTVYAIKLLFKCQYRRLQVSWVDEIRCHWAVRDCPYVLQLVDWFEDKKHVYLLLERATNGDLFDHFPLSLENSIRYIRQVAVALQACHARGIAHRDLKPENILLTTGNEIRLADFGWAGNELTYNNICGTVDYVCPQKVAASTRDICYTASTDVWSLGVLLYEMLANKLPFEATSSSVTLRKILAVDVTYPASIPPLARNLIQRLLQAKEEDRLSLVDILQHPFLTV